MFYQVSGHATQDVVVSMCVCVANRLALRQWWSHSVTIKDRKSLEHRPDCVLSKTDQHRKGKNKNYCDFTPFQLFLQHHVEQSTDGAYSDATFKEQSYDLSGYCFHSQTFNGLAHTQSKTGCKWSETNVHGLRALSKLFLLLSPAGRTSTLSPQASVSAWEAWAEPVEHWKVGQYSTLKSFASLAV